MSSITGYPKQLKLAGALLAVAALVIGLMAVVFTAGPAQAQDDDKTGPLPCRPKGGDGGGFAKLPENPVEQITTGKIALFDAYWHPDTKTLNNNLCPPSVTVQDDGFGNKTVTRADAEIDIDKTVIHVTDKYKVTVVDSAAPNYDPSAVSETTIDLAEYPFLRKWLEDGVVFDANGTATTSDGDPVQVYWLRLNDPDTADVDETSDLVLGFSTALFDKKDWFLEDPDNKKNEEGLAPFQYEFESEQDNIFEVHGPHFFAFGKPKDDDGVQKDPIWSSYDADINQLDLAAGVGFEELQWVFTESGTHHIQVHVKGHVREEKPDNAGDEWDGWERISPDEKTVASEVKVYTIQSGPLSFNQQPLFQVERSVAENSASGVKVGDPVPVAGGDDGDTLTYGLSGKRSSHFDVAAVSGGAQVTVAPGALLDYEKWDTYNLQLAVSDGKDREGQDDPSIDNVVALKISLTDVTGDPTVTIKVNDTGPGIGETVFFTTSFSGDIPAAENLEYIWVERDMSDDSRRQLNTNNPKANSAQATHNLAGERRYQTHVSWPGLFEEFGSNILSVTWTTNPSN